MRIPRNLGAWGGLVAAIVAWFVAIRPAVAHALDYHGGLSPPLLALAGVTGAIGAALGGAIWAAINRIDKGER